MKQRLLDKNVFITGASSGIGRVTAIEFAKEGANVALFSRNKERLEEVKKEIEALNRKALIFIGDVTDQESIKDAINKGNVGLYLHNSKQGK